MLRVAFEDAVRSSILRSADACKKAEADSELCRVQIEKLLRSVKLDVGWLQARQVSVCKDGNLPSVYLVFEEKGRKDTIVRVIFDPGRMCYGVWMDDFLMEETDSGPTFYPMRPIPMFQGPEQGVWASDEIECSRVLGAIVFCMRPENNASTEV
jgi:hypothetical protein